jgi:hypothetical protein
MTPILANMGIFRLIYEVLKENITRNGPIKGRNLDRIRGVPGRNGE